MKATEQYFLVVQFIILRCRILQCELMWYISSVLFEYIVVDSHMLERPNIRSMDGF